MNRLIFVIISLSALSACKSQLEKDCEKKIEGLAAMFGKSDMEKSDWPERKAAAIKKCVENGGELRPGR